MAKIKLTKGELKRQRDALAQYRRYLPTLQLKKQQLQMEILTQRYILEEKRKNETSKRNEILLWAGLLSDPEVNIKLYIIPKEIITSKKNVAGVDLPSFEHIEFITAEYDLFSMPLWVDGAIDSLKVLVSVCEEIKILEEGISILRNELRITTQRVNLFEKVKIPEAEEAIRLIKVYLGDQQTNAVGRSKIAKRKLEEAVSQEVMV